MFSPFKPFLYLIVYLAMLYVRPHEYLPDLQGVPVLSVLLMIAVLFWLARQPKRFEASQHRLLPVQLFLMSFSVLLTGWRGGAYKVVLDFGPVLLLFYVVATSVDSVKKFRVIFMILSMASTLMALHGIDQTIMEIGWTGAKMIEGRITYLGFLNDPNDLAMSMLMTLPMCLYLAGGSAGFLVRWAWRVAAVVILYGVYLTGSRGAVLALGVMSLVYGVFHFGVRRSLSLVPLVGISLLALSTGRLSNISADEESAAGRIDAWYEGFQMLKAHPLFGVGKGLFTEYNLLTAHNSFVLALAELGLVGYFVWWCSVVLMILMLLRLVGSPRNRVVAPQHIAVAGYPAVVASRVANASFHLHAHVDEVGSKSTAGDVNAVERAEFQRLARSLLYGTVGLLVCAFFLSRTYVVIVYLQMALVVAMYQMGRQRWPAIAPVLYSQLWGRLLLGCLGSVVVLWIATRVLV